MSKNDWMQVAFIWFVFFFLLLMMGCASEPPKLVSEVRTIRVEVPVPVPCAVEVPDKPKSVAPPPDADIVRKAAGVSADARALSQYADELTAALKACAAGGKP